jgi:HlyD family secretion protein
LKKILLIVGAVVVVTGIVIGTVVRAQAGYTKCLISTVTPQDLVAVVSATGQVRPKVYVNVGANAMGRVTNLYAKEGDKVHKGEVLATIENTQQGANIVGQQASIAAARTDINSYLAAETSAQANVQHAQADLQQKKLAYQRAVALYKDQVMSQQDYDTASANYQLDVASVAQAKDQLAQAVAQTASARAKLKTQQATLVFDQDVYAQTISVAPFNGVVTNEPVRQGEMVVPGIQNTEGSTIMTLADMSVVTAEVKVDETDIVNVQNGQEAEVTVDAIPGKTFKGHVTEVGDQALLRSTGQSTSETTSGVEEAKDFKVVVTLDHPTDELRPGLSCEAKIITASKKDIVAIPIEALVMRDPKTLKEDKSRLQAVSAATNANAGNPLAASPLRQGVFVVRKEKGKDRAYFVVVKTGVTGATTIQVLSGIKAGDRIVTGTYHVLRDMKEGSLVKEDTTLATPPSDNSSSSNGNSSS